jgi:NAD(P)-dependent dehydrogenase (short-subunit alcohol dehydrogenase family)
MTTEQPRVALVTGANQGLGLALVEELANRLWPADIVYLTGRNAARIATALAGLPPGRAQVRTEVLDVADGSSVDRVAAELAARHGGVDIVFGNAVMRMTPDDDPAKIIDEYVDVNNLGTTRVLRAFAPLLRDNGRLIIVASSLGRLRYLAPVLHDRFLRPGTLDEVDDVVRAWRDAILDGSATIGSWPGFINIPSKIAQVAAVRTLARTRRAADLDRGVLIAATCPGLLDTPTSSVWFDMSRAATPAQGAVALVDLALAPVDPAQYGELVQDGEVLPFGP